MPITISGHSDDLIEVEGDIREEFNVYDDGLTYLALSDGALLSITYTDAGIWRIEIERPGVNGPAAITIDKGTDEDTDYTDRATVAGDIRWVLRGTDLAKKSQPNPA